MLICPHCQSSLKESDKDWSCKNNHHFDKAKNGVTHLLVKNSSRLHGDNKDLIQARHRFLEAGYYQPLLKTLIAQIRELDFGSIVDLGCGEGYYTNAIAKAFPQTPIVGFDLSKDGLNLAAKQKNHVNYFCASIVKCPLADHSVDLVVSIFAPVFLQEIKRILRPGGRLVVVSPNPNHLLELKQVLYPTVRLNPEPQLEDSSFKLIGQKDVLYEMRFKSLEEKNALLEMTPYFYTSKPEAIEQYRTLGQLFVRADFALRVYEMSAD